MIATSSPNTGNKRVSNSQAQTIYNPNVSLTGFRFSTGPFAGMTFQEAQQFINQRRQEVQQVTGQKPQGGGSNATQQALGMGAGLAATAGIKYGLGALGGAGATTAGTAGAATAIPATPTIVSSGAANLSSAGSQVAANTAANTSANAANTANTGTSAASSYASSAAPYLAAAAWAYNQYNEAPGAYKFGQQYDNAGEGAWSNYKNSWTNNKNIGDWAKKAFDFFTFQDLLNGAYAGAGALFGSKREAERNLRKNYRLGMQDAGFMNKDSRSIYVNPDGTTFDIRDYKDKTGNHAFNIDWEKEDPNRDRRVGAVQALTNALYGGEKQGRSAMTGELYNSLLNSTDFDKNLKAQYDRLGGRDAIYKAVADKWSSEKNKKGGFSAQERDASFAAIDALYGIKNPNNSRWDSSLTGELAARNQKELQKAEALKPAPAQTVSVDRSANRHNVRKV